MKSEKVSADSKPVKRTKKSSTAAKTATPKAVSHRHSKVSAPPAHALESTAAPMIAVKPESLEVKPLAAKPIVETTAKPAAAAVAAPVSKVSTTPAGELTPVNHTVAEAAAIVTPAMPSREEIARLAHSYWVERNYAHGHAEEDWMRAERALTSASAKA